MRSADAVVYGASEVVVGPDREDRDETESGDTIRAAYDVPDRFGPEQALEVQDGGAVAIEDGVVALVESTDDVIAEYPLDEAAVTIDADGRCVVPGFVDPHTHAVFAGDRSDEFAARLRGRDYQEILADGGGILRTVGAVRSASDGRLLDRLLDHLDTALAYGTTTIEVKSGYGLDTETELRLLDAISRADERHPVDVVPTFLGAHAVPEDASVDAYVDRVVDDQLPAVADQGVARFCDVFCEEGVFDVEQSRRILEAGRTHGLGSKLHADEFTRLGGADLAAELETISADHLLHASPSDVTALGEAGVVPTYLPAAAFSLQEPFANPAPAVEAGMPIALGTDFNPNCHSISVPMTVALACVRMGLSPEAALVGVTRAAALSIDLRDGTGTLREGAPGDLVVLDAPGYVDLPYRFGQNPVDRVLKGGAVVASPAEGIAR